jgi:hypothetical protein
LLFGLSTDTWKTRADAFDNFVRKEDLLTIKVMHQKNRKKNLLSERSQTQKDKYL